jgi:ribosome biogenesis protein ERB1
MQKNVELTEEELDIIHRLAKSENPDANYDRAYLDLF